MAVVRRTGHPLEWPTWFTRGVPEIMRWPETGFPDDLDDQRMAIEELREDDTLVVRAEMPGIDPEKDVEITVLNDTLTISAERRQKTEETENGRVRSEFRYGRFSRRMSLPAGTTEDEIKASYEDGILEIRVPIADEKTRERKIPINRG